MKLNIALLIALEEKRKREEAAYESTRIPVYAPPPLPPVPPPEKSN